MISELCIYDLARDAIEVVLRHESGEVGRIEAPNWIEPLPGAAPGATPDSARTSGSDAGPDDCPDAPARFLVNAAGRLHVADARGLSGPLDLSGHTACNNDHGLSPDGRTIAYCDKTQTGQSCIYLVDWDGSRTTGAPRRVTPDVPSWFHGWLPDGGGIVYAGARGERVVRPYLWDLGAGEERLLASGFDHVDGPDATPDGRHVWFNGERDGAVDLWRVALADGRATGEPERMTRGGTVDWFPHPSPCGRHVVFIAYPAGTTGHPFGVEVGLCLMPMAGGPVREVARIFGGQGCLNVPGWAPDGHAFAFVRYDMQRGA